MAKQHIIYSQNAGDPWRTVIVIDGDNTADGETVIPAAKPKKPAPPVPEKIRKMRQLYDYNSASFLARCKNFYRQAVLMADYEDDAPYHGDFYQYFPTYHDLNTEQLRGYFTWRTQLRRGNFTPIATSLAYLYLYELLYGIGADSKLDVLAKMRAFEKGFLDSGIGDSGMRKNLHRWMLEYGVLNNLPPEIVRSFADPDDSAMDAALAALKDPKARDAEIVQAMAALADKRLPQSAVFKKAPDKAAHLFAEAWRRAAKDYRGKNGKHLFAACFNRRSSKIWHPLGNTLYRETRVRQFAIYELDACRSYRCHAGVWRESCYSKRRFNKKLFRGFVHETDRLLRLYLGAGRPLKARPEDAWADDYINAVTAEDAAATAAKPEKPSLTIDFSQLGRIRSDAAVTRDSLLTEEEMADDAMPVSPNLPDSTVETASAEPADAENAIPLDDLHLSILKNCLAGEDTDALIRKNRLMPSVVADTINAALFDAIGDNVLACEDGRLTLIEDYREDLLDLIAT